MYTLRRSESTPLPTGSNPLPPLSEFEVKKTLYRLDTQIPYGQYSVEIDLHKEVGFFEHATNQAIKGQFWLAGHVVVASEHILPRDVRTALKNACIEVA